MNKKEIEEEFCDDIHVHDDVVKKVNGKMLPEEELCDLADFYKTIADATRIKILFVLFCAETCVCDIAQILNMSQSSISHQLRILKQAKLVTNRRAGKTIYYSLADEHIFTILNQGIEHINE